MVQWAVQKLYQRWRYGWSREKFLNWNRSGATDGPDSSEQFTNWNRGGATDSPVSSYQTETEVALRMVLWGVQKLKQRWRFRLSIEQFTKWNRGGATDNLQTGTEAEPRMNGMVGRTQTKTEVIQWPFQILWTNMNHIGEVSLCDVPREQKCQDFCDMFLPRVLALIRKVWTVVVFFSHYL
jgi:hypothetical protein